MIAAPILQSLVLLALALPPAQSPPLPDAEQQTTVSIAPASTEDVHAAIDTCVAITASDWIDIAALRGPLGWKNLVTAADNLGNQPVAGIFRKQGSEALILITGGDLHEKRCRVVARLSQPTRYRPLAGAVRQWLGKPQFKVHDRYTWRQGYSTIRMIQSGTGSESNAEFAISSSKKRNKDTQ